MAIYAATCPCCGRDIGFDENASEHTCIFCGAKLITAALAREKLDSNGKAHDYEHYRDDDALDAAFASRREAVHMPTANQTPSSPQPMRPYAQPQNTNSSAQSASAEQGEKPLTDEEVREQLMRKAGFKQELRAVVKEIDVLRGRRKRYESGIKLSKLITLSGVILMLIACVLAFSMLNDDLTVKANLYPLIIAAVLLMGGVGLTILAEVRKKGIAKQQKKLEDSIADKKGKRDTLIGRLNKINHVLHIHEDE